VLITDQWRIHTGTYTDWTDKDPTVVDQTEERVCGFTRVVKIAAKRWGFHLLPPFSWQAQTRKLHGLRFSIQVYEYSSEKIRSIA